MRLVVAVAAAAITYYFTNSGQAAAWAFNITMAAGAVLFPEAGPSMSGPRLSDLKVQDSTYGSPINMLLGAACRMSGQVIWCPPFSEHQKTQEQGGKGGGGGSEVTTYSYTASAAIAICEGPIVGIRKIWADGKLIFDVTGAMSAATATTLPSSTVGGIEGFSEVLNLIHPGTDSTTSVAPGGWLGADLNVRIYLGDETQMPDPLIESKVGVGNTPAYRGLAYVVFEDFSLTNFANHLPAFSFEVVKKGADTYTVSTIAQWDFDTTLGTFFSAPDLTSGAVTVLGWGYYYGYTGVRSMTFTAGGTATSNGFAFGAEDAPGFGFPIVGNSDVPGALSMGSGGCLAWLTPDGQMIQTTLPQLTIVNVQSSFYRRNNVIWYTAIYGLGAYHIYRYDIGAGTLVESTDTGSLTIIGVSDSYLYVTCFQDMSLRRYNKDTLEYVSTVMTDSDFMATGTGYVVSDNEIYISKGSALFKVDVAAGTSDLIFWTGGGGVASMAVLPGGGILWATTTLGSPWQLKYAANNSIGTVPLSQVVTELCAKVGLTPADIDVSELTDNVDGYVVGRRTSVRACLEPLAAVYQFDGTESDHVIKFPKRGHAPIRTLTAEDLAAYDSGDEPPPVVAGERANDLELPVRVDCVYMRRDSDYQNTTQSARRETAPGDNVVSLELPMVLSDQDARTVAQNVLLNSWMGRQKEAWQTTRKHLDLDPCDIVVLPLASGNTPVRITKKDESRNGLVKWEGEVYDASTSEGYGVNTSGGPAGQQLTLPPQNSAGILLDAPALLDTDDNAGFYWATSGSSTDVWPGAALLRALDGWSYAEIGRLVTETVIGATTTALGNGPTHIFDEGNVITVQVLKGTLSSTTRELLFNGANACMIGNEVLQFRNATLIDTNTYSLSGLLRGRKGTEKYVGTHAGREIFVLLGTNGIQRINTGISELNLERTYKVATVGQDLAKATASPFTNHGRALVPYSPVQLRGGRNAAGDLTIGWRRRTRIGGELRDSVDVPVSETSEAYDVEIWGAGFTSLKRTFAGLTAPTVTYTAAQQVTDFGSTSSLVYVRIYQLSAVVGRGDVLQGAI